ncbi:MAG: hypothetical protein Ct9H300mP16_19840 [Pseudomonadota bacterium]|nr:MAG: hypothetical protein Ct9H300mP16_19840 [Pseudomonadota bacterium]
MFPVIRTSAGLQRALLRSFEYLCSVMQLDS